MPQDDEPSMPMTRQDLLSAIESKTGLRLPDMFRGAIEADGTCEVAIKGDFGAKSIVVVLGERLTADGVGGWNIFLDFHGGTRIMGGWIPLEELGFETTYIPVNQSGSGDSFILGPDENGIARKLYFLDHETGEISEVTADIDAQILENS